MIASPVTARSPLAGPAGGGHDLTGGETDPDLQRLPAVVRFAQGRPDGERGQRGTNRIVVVRTGPAEDGEDRVAYELLARPVETLDGVGHAAEGGPDTRSDLFGIVLGDHADVVHKIREECRDDPTVARFLDLDTSGGRRGWPGRCRPGLVGGRRTA